ncbi:hypothetical protein B0H10DRAFT_2216431 [Mycena sp. CBHHK59/15]|nr:hypothetical protein B0H10DRAFT_2216431 [Mycena sp. CBHHK59/15]
MFPFNGPYPITALEAASFDDSIGSDEGIYDFIVVGGGTSGCVLANRLSEDPTVKVLLLERGDARTGWSTRVPLMSTNFMGDASAAYRWPAACTVGDARTLTLYTRGFPAEYDRWSEGGCRGWSYAELEPYFKKSEGFTNAKVLVTEHHGTQGLFEQDHMAVGIMYSVPTGQSLHILQASRFRAMVELFRYIAFGEGLFLAPVTQLSILVDSARVDEAGHIVPLVDVTTARLPDLELMPIHFNYSDPPIPIEAGAFSLKVGLVRPRSRGIVALASDDPLQRPACDLAFLSDAADYAVMHKGIKLAKRIGEKMRELGCTLMDMYMPDSEADADLDAFVRKTVRTTYHYGCTCRMAPERDAGVVDDVLRVHGRQW